MKYLFYILLIILIQIFSVENSVEQYLQRSHSLEEQGKPKEAVQVLGEAVGGLKTPSLSIATEYLRIATEYKFKDLYPTASSVYQWGLSGRDKASFSENSKALEKELARLKPLLNIKNYKKYEKLLVKKDAALFQEISGFWKQIDPTPATIYNERLIEHWQRIAYAKAHFTLEKNSPYGTDERGIYYVKYGEPDKTDKGRVRITYDTIRPVLNQLMPGPDTDPNTAGGNNFNLMKVSNRIQNLFVNPEYEIWIFNTPGTMTENMVLIFGHRSGGSFDRLETLEDFIPESAFNLRVRSQVDPGLPPVPAGMVLQWLYYEYFAKKDPYFARLFNEYYSTMQRYIGIGSGDSAPPDPFSMWLTKNQNIVSAYQVNRRAPDKFSTEEKKIPDIPIMIHQYRMLDESSQPVFVTFMESRPLQAFLSDYTANKDVIQSSNDQISNEENSSWYDLIHGIQLRDENWDILAKSKQLPRLIFHPDEPYISSVFEIPWGGDKINQIFYAKLLNTHPDSKPRVESIFSDSLRGLGKLQIEQAEPLEVETGKMVMSDLILGYQKTEQTDNQSYFDFVAANDRRIPEGENLVVHFELYELQTDSTGMSHFEVEYEITPKSGLLGWIKRKRDEFTITLEFDNYGNRFAETLEIEVAGLEKGTYELKWSIHDTLSGERLAKKLEFEVDSNLDL